jgi:hypothetical protein
MFDYNTDGRSQGERYGEQQETPWRPRSTEQKLPGVGTSHGRAAVWSVDGEMRTS